MMKMQIKVHFHSKNIQKKDTLGGKLENSILKDCLQQNFTFMK